MDYSRFLLNLLEGSFGLRQNLLFFFQLAFEETRRWLDSVTASRLSCLYSSSMNALAREAARFASVSSTEILISESLPETKLACFSRSPRASDFHGIDLFEVELFNQSSPRVRLFKMPMYRSAGSLSPKPELIELAIAPSCPRKAAESDCGRGGGMMSAVAVYTVLVYAAQPPQGGSRSLPCRQ